MKKKKKKDYFMIFNKIKIEYGFLTTLITSILIIGFIFGTKHIYPFGKDIFSLLDFDSGYIPTYYKLWDILHFKSSAFYDWNLGAGLNVLGSMIMNGFISPTSWLIGLFSRNSIPYTISFVLIFKLLCMSSICYYSIGKIFSKTEQKYKVLFSLIYTFSNFTLLMATHILYLDAISLFPLLVYGLVKFLKTGKWGLYFGTLNAVLLMSFYQGWMDLFFIIGFSSLYLLFFKEDKKQQKAITLFLLTLLSLFTAGILFIPGLMQTMTSYRMSTNTSDDEIFTVLDFYNKFIYILGLGVTFGFIIKQLCIKKDKKINIFIILLLLYLLIGIVIEPINAMWHTGSHTGFPFRYGHIPTFITCLISIYYLNNNYKENKKKTKKYIYAIIICLFIVLLIFSKELIKIFDGSNIADTIDNHGQIWGAFFFMVISSIITIVNMKNNNKVFVICLYGISLLNIMLFGYILTNNLDNKKSVYTQEIANNYNLKNDGYNYKLTDEFNINAPYIMNVPSLENRLHFIQESELTQTQGLGYYSVSTIVYSYNGTIFSDLLTLNKYTFTYNELNNKLYTLLESKDGLNLYELNYNLDYLIPYNGKDYNELDDNVITNLNNIYKTLFDKEKDLFELITYNKENTDFTFKTNDKYIYYVYSNEIGTVDSIRLKTNTKVNGIIIEPSFNAPSYLLQELNESNGKDTVSFTKPYYIYKVNIKEYIEFVDSLKLNTKVTTKGSKRTYEFKSDKKQSILIPVNYDDSFKILVNGKETDYKINLYNMISIDVEEGNNKVELIYTNKWFKVGVISTILSSLLILIMSLINKKFDLLKYKFIRYPLFGVCVLFVLLFFIKIYILTWL